MPGWFWGHIQRGGLRQPSRPDRAACRERPGGHQWFRSVIDTASAGTIWSPYGTSLSQGDDAQVGVDCPEATTDVSYTVELYDAPSTPAVLSGAATLDVSDPDCVDVTCSTNLIDFVTPATAHYVADLTLTQGSVDLSPDAAGGDQVFASSGRFDLGYLGAGVQEIQFTPQDGPAADWSLSIHALPVVMSGLSFDVPYIRPTQITTISYSVDGDVQLTATIQNQSGQAVRTLASGLAVAAGDHTLNWDGLDGSGSPVPDGSYTLQMAYTDAAGNSGTSQASIGVDSTPPVVSATSSATLNSSNGLVIDVHDALSGLKSATLAVDGKHAASLNSSGTQFIYVPVGGWKPGSHTWDVTATTRRETAAAPRERSRRQAATCRGCWGRR